MRRAEDADEGDRPAEDMDEGDRPAELWDMRSVRSYNESAMSKDIECQRMYQVSRTRYTS